MGTLKVQLKRPPREKKEGSGRQIELLSEAKYAATFASFEEATDDYGGLRVTLNIPTASDPKDRFFRVFPASEAMRTLVDLAGGDAEAKEAEFDSETLVGTNVFVYVGTRTAKGSGKTFNTIKRFAPRKK